MQISTRLAIAIHVLACIDTFKDSFKMTSQMLAQSVNVNPVVIRRILSQLKSAGIIDVARGVGGATIKKPLDEVTLLDVFNAVECVEHGKLFHIHENPSSECPVGRNIHTVLSNNLGRVQKAMENEMKAITLADIIGETQDLIKEEGLEIPTQMEESQ